MNRKTRFAKKNGYCSQKDMLAKNENKIFKGSVCDTSFQAAACKRNSPKKYGKRVNFDEE